MATTITMPQLGETVTEGTVAQWLKAPGDAIEKYEAFVEISTDKVNAEVPSPVSGTLREIVCREGETVAVGATIAIIDEASAAASTPESAPAAPAATPAPVEPSSYGASGGPAHGNGATNGSARAAATVASAPVRDDPALLRGMSPAVRRLARAHDVDLTAVRGTGHNGRVTANDVVLASRTAPPAPAPAAPPATARPAATAGATVTGKPGTSTYASPVPGTVVPLTQARKIIAQRMVESLETAPHAWTMVEVDVTNLWTWRARAKERFAADKGVTLTLLPFFISAVVAGLKRFPLLNSRFTDDGIFVHREINVGIAIGLESTLVVPVIRDADTLSIGGLAVAAGRLIERARTGKLSADELGGGTFTVNNTGANGSILSKPIINGGQAGIVTMEAVVKRPVVRGDAIAIRSIMNVCLSLDHRVLDGTSANAFLGFVKTRLEAMGPEGDV